MAKRGIPELREKSEMSCMWGLFSILESCQGSAGPKLISNGRRVNKHILDYPREFDLQFTSFDEECRKIQSGVDLASVTVDGKTRNRVNFIQAHMPFEKNKTKQSTIKREKHAKMDSELVDYLMETHKRARKNSQKSYQSTSADLSLNKLTLDAILGAVSSHNHHENSTFSEHFERSIHLGKYNEVEEFNMQQVQISAKAFVDQMFIDRRQFICKERKSSESNYSFSDALQVLNSNKDMFMKNLRQFQTEKETGLNSVNSEKGKMKKKNTSLPSNKIVILKPAPENAKRSEEISCHCSSQRSLNRRVSDNKPASYSFREMKKKLKHTFGGTRKELHEFDIDKFSIERSSVRTGDKCTCGGFEIRRSSSSSNSFRTNEKEDFKSNTGFSDIASVTETVRKKVDSSRFVSSKKHEFDVILEAKRHLSTRLKNQNAVENETSQKSPKTLRRILLYPEPDFWPISPKRDRNGREMACLSPLRPNTEVTSFDDCNRYDGVLPTLDSKMKSNGESNIAETNSKFQPELQISEVATETMESHKDDEIHVMHSISDLFSENEASTSTVDDFPSTPSSIKYQEHRSPDSVLEPFFTEDTNSPPNTTPQTDRPKLQPLHLDFEECSFQPFPHNQPISAHSCIEEQDHLSQYVHLVLQASCLNWDLLSEIRSQPQELLHESLFEEVEFLPNYFDPKLLFDHINEVLAQICQSHFCFPPWQTFVRPKVKRVPLAEVVVDEILKEADFYLLPRTEESTLDQLVSKDVADCSSWLDVRLDIEEIVVETSEDILEEYILDILIEFHR